MTSQHQKFLYTQGSGVLNYVNLQWPVRAFLSRFASLLFFLSFTFLLNLLSFAFRPTVMISLSVSLLPRSSMADELRAATTGCIGKLLHLALTPLQTINEVRWLTNFCLCREQAMLQLFLVEAHHNWSTWRPLTSYSYSTGGWSRNLYFDDHIPYYYIICFG